MHLRTIVALAVTATLGIGAVGSADVAQAAPPAPGGFHSLTPDRILDTRSGIGATPGPASVTTFAALGRGGVPATNVSAVVFNLTVVNPSSGTYVTAYPSGTAQPNVSNINVPAGMTRANMVTVPVGADGKVSLYNNSGTLDLLADVLGYYDTNGTSGGFVPTDPATRLFDSRDPQFGGPLHSGEGVDIPVSYGAGVDPHITALALNITAIQAQAPGWMTAWSGGGPVPNASTVNFNAHDNVPNTAIVPVRQESWNGTLYPTFSLVNFAGGSTDLATDVVGFYTDGQLSADLRYQPVTPTRVLDTRTAFGGLTRFQSGETKSGTVPQSIADANTYDLAVNLTAVTPSASTYLTFWYSGEPQPGTSNLNANALQDVANSGFIDPDYSIFNAWGATDVIIDVQGRFQLNQAPANARAQSQPSQPPAVPAWPAAHHAAPALRR